MTQDQDKEVEEIREYTDTLDNRFGMSDRQKYLFLLSVIDSLEEVNKIIVEQRDDYATMTISAEKTVKGLKANLKRVDKTIGIIIQESKEYFENTGGQSKWHEDIVEDLDDLLKSIRGEQDDQQYV